MDVYTLIGAITGFILTVIGAGLIGSRLNESKHRSKLIKDQDSRILDLTDLLGKNEKLNHKEKAEIVDIVAGQPVDRINGMLNTWPDQETQD